MPLLATPEDAEEESSQALTLELNLEITDPEVVGALVGIDDLRRRHDYAAAALRVGIRALRDAGGQVDQDRVRAAGDQLLGELQALLGENSSRLVTQLDGILRRYSDPEDGLIAQRMKRLCASDGDLAQVLRPLVSGDSSELAKTLMRHVGESSPLFRRLDPAQANGLLGQIEQTLSTALTTQANDILRQFSLDNKDSALGRMLERIADAQADLRNAFTSDLSKVVGEFSLDSEGSALSRMKGHLGAQLEALAKSDSEFKAEVREILSRLETRKAVEAQGTLHGRTFEEQVSGQLEALCHRTGDLFEACGATTGLIRNCKVGDQVVALGPDCGAAGARIVFEAKEDASYDDRRALEDLAMAKKNRGAGLAVFVFSRASGGDRPPFRRFGDDLLVVWDAQDPRTDIYLDAALSIARALAIRQAAVRGETTVDLAAIEKAILEIERQAAKLDCIQTSGNTIKNGAQKILDEARVMKDSLIKQTKELHEQLVRIREELVRASS
jgi:hypothetical protein